MTENDAQAAIVNYCRRVLQRPWFIFAVPNKVPRGKTGRALSGCPGFTKGVSDLVLIGPARVIFIEVKRPASEGKPEGKLRLEQVVFLDAARACGFDACVWRGIDDARNTFKALGITTRESKS